MAGSVNKVILVGNLGRDPEVRSTQNGDKIVNFSIATSERWKDKSHDVWVAEEDVGEAAIEEFEEQRKPVNSQVQVGPYVSTAAQTIDEELADDLV